MLVFSVYIPFLISRVRPVHSIFEKKSILENPSQIFTNLFFHAYMAYMPSFFAWLFRPAFKDNKVISSFSTFLRLLLSFFDIPRIISQFSESLGALRIASLVSQYPLIDSVQCDKPLFLISVVPAVQFVRRNPPFSGQVIDFELLVRGNPPSSGQISVGTPAHLRRLPTAGNSVKLIDRVNGSATRLPP